MAIGIYEVDNSNLIPVGAGAKTKTLASGANTTIEFVAKYVSTAATVKAGTANSVSNFTVSYN